MKRVYSKVTRGFAAAVRWVIAAVISMIVAIPPIVALTESV
jgi:hypothetical protein